MPGQPVMAGLRTAILVGMRASDYSYFDAPFLAFAHRGGSTYPPNLHRENTMYAFDQATGLGYRYLETDVHATVDGVLLAFHDTVLDRVTDATGSIAELPYERVREARIAGIDPIPTLAELLTRYPEARFNIDAKAPAAVELLVDTINTYDAHDRVCVSSFSTKRLHQLRQRLGDRVPSALSFRGVAWTRFMPLLPRWIQSPGLAFQLPISYSLISKWLGGREREVRVLTETLIRHAHRAGKQVHIWTIDDVPTMELLIDMGVDGIFTDRIDTLKAVLVARGLWS